MTPHEKGPLTLVLVVSNLEFGGTQRQVVHLASALDPRRFTVHVCSLSPYVPLAAGASALEGHLHLVRKHAKFDISVIPRLAALLRRLRADIAHGFLFDAQLATRIAGRLAGVPVVIDSERNSNYQIRWLKRLAFRLTRGCVDLVIANSRAGAEFHQRVHGHPPERYRVVRNGVDTGRFHPIPRDEVRQELHLAESDVVVGMFGSYKVQKNHPLFFAAATRVLGMHRHARFLVVGDELAGGLQGSDAQKRRVAQLVDALGLRDRCVFLGNRQDVERLYNACDVVVLPSIREGTPNVLLEAMACGIPVVATDVADNASIVPDGRVGFVVPSGNEELLAERLGRLVTDQGLRDAFGRAARNWALEEFSLTRLANETAAVYEAAWLGKASRNSASVLPRNRPRDDSNTTSKRS